jgi:hypothetical protein
MSRVDGGGRWTRLTQALMGLAVAIVTLLVVSALLFSGCFEAFMPKSTTTPTPERTPTPPPAPTWTMPPMATSTAIPNLPPPVTMTARAPTATVAVGASETPEPTSTMSVLPKTGDR